MGLSSRLPLLLLLSVLPTAMCTEQRDLVSYVRMDYVIHGTFSEKLIVDNVKQCTDRADRKDSFGFVLEKQDGNDALYACQILQEFHFLEKWNNTDSPRWYYLQDKSSSNKCPREDGPFPVSQVLQYRGQCVQKRDSKCQQLEELESHCKAVNTTDCTLPCGENEIRKAPDFTSCCPAYEKEDGQKACCPDGERVIPGAKECCAAISLPNGTALCCPEKSSCRPQSEEVVARSREGLAVCCPQGMKVMEGTSKCCPNTFDYSDVFRQCVGVVQFDRKPKNVKELDQLCVDKNARPVKVETEDQAKYLSGDTFGQALIGLAIPDGEEWGSEKFRWIIDGSKPTFTWWLGGQPNNAKQMRGGTMERFVRMKAGRWMDTNDGKDMIQKITCTANAYEWTASTSCCPAYEKEDGKEACCPDGERVIPGAKECCAAISLPNGKQVCCPKKTFSGNDKNGIELCCPEKESCCPKGQEVVARAEDVAVCCPQGMTVIESTTKCCLNTFDYSDVFRQCVGVVQFDRKPESVKELNQLCVEKNARPVKVETEDQAEYLSGDTFDQALIGLAIPDGEEWGGNNFRWVVDGSKPTYTYWRPREPNNLNERGAGTTERFVRIKSSRWIDVNNGSDMKKKIICTANAYEGARS